MPVEPSSRILAASSTDRRDDRRRSLASSSSAIRALIIEKLISTTGYSTESSKLTPIRPSRTQRTVAETWPWPSI